MSLHQRLSRCYVGNAQGLRNDEVLAKIQTLGLPAKWIYKNGWYFSGVPSCQASNPISFKHDILLEAPESRKQLNTHYKHVHARQSQRVIWPGSAVWIFFTLLPRHPNILRIYMFQVPGPPLHPPCHGHGHNPSTPPPVEWVGPGKVGVIQPPTNSNVTGRRRWRKLISGKKSMYADINYTDAS